MTDRGELLRRAGYVTARDLAEATGATYRQIDSWTAAGLLGSTIRLVGGEARPGAGTGYPRGYDPGEVEIVRRVAGLVRAGMAPAHAFALARRGPGRYPLADGVCVVIGESVSA